jgi:hypothetical protein
MAELKAQSASGDESLEALFLRLTGGLQASGLEAIFDEH